MFRFLRTLAILFVSIVVAVPVTASATVKVSSQPTSKMNCSGGICSPTARKAILNVTDLANMLAAGDVFVQSGSLAQDIEINAALSWTSTHRLTLDSYHSIAFNQPLTVAGTGALTIATNDGGTGGDFAFFEKGGIKFWDTGSSLIINGHAYMLLNRIGAFQRELRRDDGTGRYFAISKNWDLSRTVYSEPPIGKDFNGTLEGLGNSISNLSVHDSTAGKDVAFFPGLDLDATIRDLDLRGVDIAGTATGQQVGALVGGNSATLIQHVSVTGQVSGIGSGSKVGGLIGVNGGTLVACTSAATATGGEDTLIGGLVGWNTKEVREPAIVSISYSTGTVSNGGPGAGGAVGQTSGGTVSDSYATGNVMGLGSTPTGGLIGMRSAASDGSVAVVASSYSTGAISSGAGAPVGGSIGEDDVAGSGIGNDYWDLDTSGVSNPHQGAGNVLDDPGIAGLTDAQLKSGLPVGFDPKIWAINPKINNGYPYLIANPPRN